MKKQEIKRLFKILLLIFFSADFGHFLTTNDHIQLYRWILVPSYITLISLSIMWNWHE